MEDKKLKKSTTLGKIAFNIMTIGVVMMMIAIAMAAFRTDTLCGIAVSGLFLSIIGIAIGLVDSRNRKNNQEE